MSAWDSDLSSIIEKTNNNLKLLRKIGDKPQVRAPDVSTTAGPPLLARSGSASGSISSHSSARPRAYVGANDDAGSVSSRSSGRPKAFVRGEDDSSSMGSHSSARPRAFIRADDDAGSMGSRSSARPKAFVRADDDAGSMGSRSSARPKVYVGDDGTGSVSSRSSARPKAFIRGDDDSGSVSSRASARPKAYIRGDDDSGSVSSRASARPKAYVRGDDDTGSMSSNQGLGRARLDSSHGSVASSSGRPHVGIAGGGGLTAAMLQQHRAVAGVGPAMPELGARPRYDLDETRSMTGSVSSRLSRRVGATGRVPHARPLGASMGPRIRVAESDIPSDIPSHVIDEIKKSLETQFASRNSSVDKKVADLRTDVSGLTTQTSSLSSQVSQLREAMLTSVSAGAQSTAGAVADPKVIANVQANAAAISRLEEHSADLMGRRVSADRELSELGARVKSLSSATMKISTMEDNVEALVGVRAKHEQAIEKVWNKVTMMHRQMGSLVDMKAVENLLSIRLTREFREMEDRMSQNVARMAEKMEQKVQNLEKQALSQRQESLAALKSDLTDDITRLQSSALRKSDILPLQNAQTQSKEELAQLSGALDRQEKKLQDAKLASTTLRDELADARAELNKALLSQQRSASATMEEKLEQIANSNKDKTSKIDDQLAELARKQKKLEDSTKTLQETMTQVKVEASQRLNRSSVDREEENDKLRQRLARSVAELEALATTKADVERRFASDEQQFQARLKELRSTLTETEKQKETQRLELMQKLQEESKLMGVAQGKNTLLEALLAREKTENEEKNELVRKSKKEVAEVREQIRGLEAEKEKRIRQLSSELQAKQTQVGLLTKTLKRIETASAKMLDLSKREAKTVRRVKATKEHELFIAQLKLKEMERVAQALQNGDELKKQAALTAASTEERNELEKLLLESQLEKDELKQELQEMSEEFNAAKESQKVIMEDTITKLSSDYDEKISELKQQIADKEQAMRLLRETVVEKSNLDALEDELTALKDEKNDLLEQMQRAQIEHERVVLKTETNLRLEHATEFSAIKSKLEERIAELEGVQNELEATKVKIAELESEMEKQEALHQREVSTLTHQIKEARGKIDECTAQTLTLKETKARLEGEISQMEANIGGASAEKEEQLAAIKSQMQSEVDKLRAELHELSTSLEENQAMLKDAKQSDEANRQKLVEMAMAQEEMQGRYVAQIDSLTLKLNQERESSRSREQELEDIIDKLNADIKALKAEASNELEASRSELTDQMSELTTTLKASQNREQQLQSRLKRILEELVQAANASGDNEVPEDADVSDDDSAITHHLDALYATHRRTAHELERLQAEYDLTVKQAAADSATAQELENQVKEHETQIRELESVVEQLRDELKEQYHKSAVLAKGSDEFSDEMASLRDEKRQLERQLQVEERDREKREVSYQRRTEVKERELEELREENKSFSAAAAAIRKKIQSVESAKFRDLDEMHKQLKELEDRTAALQPDENNVAKLEKDFTATRQEIVSLTGEVQSLYQKLTACCGILEWTELRASVFDEEEKLTRVRTESTRELAKVKSVEQEVLTNAEFLNALLVAHGSTGGDENLLNDFRWMQKYASIAPEIVEKLRKVESRLREAVLDLHDGSASLFSDGAAKVPKSNTSSANSVGNAERGVPQPPSSQNSSVDGAAIALALEKARDDYFSETSEAADEVEKHDVDQPDVEHEGEEQENPVDDGISSHEEEGANSEHVDVNVDEQGLIGGISHDEPDICEEMEVAEHVVHAEQEISYEEQGAASIATSDLEDEGSSIDAAFGSIIKKQDRSSDNGFTPGGDRTIGMTKIRSKWSSPGFSSGGDEDEDMDEVERLMLEQSLANSGKQLKPHLGNEGGGGDEFEASFVSDEAEEKHSAVVDDELGEKSFGDTMLAKHGDVISSCMKRDLLVSQQIVVSLDGERSEENTTAEQDTLDESSFNDDDVESVHGHENAILSSNDVSTSQIPQQILRDEAELAESSDTEGYAKHDDTLAESSFDKAMMSENDVDAGSSHLGINPVEHQADLDGHSDGEELTALLPETREYSFQKGMLSDSEGNSASVTKELETSQPGESNALEISSSSIEDDALAQHVLHGEISPAGVARIRPNDELLTELSDDDESNHGTAGEIQDTLADSSFDADIYADEDSTSIEVAESSPHLLKSQYDEGEWSDEQLRSAENSLDDGVLEYVTDTCGSMNTTPSMGLRMEEDDESSEEEETMAVGHAPPALSTNLSRFGMGTHRLSLEEDDDMDEVERLLLEQSAASMEKQQQQVPSRFTRPLSDDDDEFGELSLQSRSDNADEFGEASIRSRENEQFGVSSLQSRSDNSGEFGEASVRSRENEEFGESSLQSRSDNSDEFGEASIRSLENDDFGAASLQPRDENDNRFDNASVQAQENNDLREHITPHNDDEFGEASLQSRSDNTAEFGEASIQSRGDGDDLSETLNRSRGEESAKISFRLRQGNEHGETSIESQDHDEFDERSQDEVDQFPHEITASTMYQQHQKAYSKFTRSTTDDDEVKFGESLLQSHGDHDDEFDESLIHDTNDEVSTTSARPLNNHEVGESSLQSQKEDDFGESSNRSHEGEEFDESSLQSRESDEFGEGSSLSQEDEVERLLLEHSESRVKQDQQQRTTNLNRITRRFADDDKIDVELGETSLQSRRDHDDEFGEASARSRNENDDDLETLTHSHENEEFEITSINSRDEDEFGEISHSGLSDHAATSHRDELRTDFHGSTLADHVAPTESPTRLVRNPDMTIATTTIHNDSTSETEHDYLGESFDLDESLEDDGERV